MRIGKYQITGGPNWQFYAVTALFVYWSYEGWTPWPLLGWAFFCLLLIPASLLIHRWTRNEQETEEKI